MGLGPARLRTAVPVGVKRAQGSGGRRIGRQAKQQNRRCTPIRPVACLARRSDEPPQPAHRARRAGRAIIARAGNHRNWNDFRNPAPRFPVMELVNSVGPHQPDKAVLRVAADQSVQGVDGKTGALPGLEIADPDRRSPRHSPRRGKPRFERGHALGGLERVARRNQPPHFVEAERVQCRKADPAMPAVRRIERAAEKSDARHPPEPLAWRRCRA